VVSAARALKSANASFAPRCSPKGVEQAVKAVCSVMGHVETTDISTSVEGFRNAFRIRPAVEVVGDHGSYSTVGKQKLE